MSADPTTRPLAEEALEVGKSSAPLGFDLTHWRGHQDASKVQWWLLDQSCSQMNTLSKGVLEELELLLQHAEEQKPLGIVIRSVKVNGFIAGAEIDEFRGVNDEAAIQDRLTQGHALLQRLEKLSSPTIALIHGFCLGGGLELALACNYRISRADASFGFPEVRLGLHPGLGGTVRLPRLIAPPEALKMMLTGKSIGASKAEALGLVDAVGEERHFANAISQAIGRTLPTKRAETKIRLMSTSPVRRAITYWAERQTRSRLSADHYPAPFALLEAWREHGGEIEAMAEAERQSFAKLLTGDTAQNLVRVFFLRNALQQNGQGTDADIRHVHVVGAGTMGGDIAAWCAAHGCHVTLQDQAADAIGRTIKRAQQMFERVLKSDIARRNAHDRLVPDQAGEGAGRADLVIEAVPEDLALKQKIFGELEGHLKSGAILATNTSSISLERLGERLKQPERLVGIHFFNPVARMQLIEIVTHAKLDPQVQRRALAFAVAIDRLPVAVQTAPGFLINRVLTPYLLEALALIDEGVPKPTIDAAAVAFGMPMGPVELADQVGLDVCLHVAEHLHRELDQSLYDIPAWFKELVDDGALGKKTARGLYDYDDAGEAKKALFDGEIDATLQDRLLLPFLDNCVRCLAEKIVSDADQLDAAVVFATGFAPFRGGPMHYAKARGSMEIVGRMRELAIRYGERFEPSSGWSDVFDEQ